MPQDTVQPFTLSSENSPPPKKIYLPTRSLSRETIDETAARMKERASIGQWSSYPDVRSKSDKLILEANRLSKCGRNWRLETCADCKTEYHSPVSCNSRICPRCSYRYAEQYKEALTQALLPLFARKRRGKALMMVTTSISSQRFGSQLPDRDGFDRFYRESALFMKTWYGKWRVKQSKNGKLVEDATRYRWVKDDHGRRVKERRKPIIRVNRNGKTVEEWRQWRGSGAVSVAELGNSGKRAGYMNNNLHCHCLVYGDFIPVKVLRASWKEITKDSQGVYVSQVKTLKQAVYYVLKYITKPPRLTNPDALAEWAQMLKGVRRLRTSGIFVGQIKREKREKFPHHCPKCGGYLCECCEGVIEEIDIHPSLSLYREQRQAVQMPPPTPQKSPLEQHFERLNVDFYQSIGAQPCSS
jgi:hypothetical protein